MQDLRAIGSKGINPRTFACVEQFLTELPRRIAALERGLPAGCETIANFRRMLMMAREGDLDGAYAAAMSALNDDLSVSAFLYGRDMSAFRADPRFMPLAKRLGLLDYWSKSGHWPDFCSEPGLPYDCRAAAVRLLRAP